MPAQTPDGPGPGAALPRPHAPKGPADWLGAAADRMGVAPWQVAALAVGVLAVFAVAARVGAGSDRPPPDLDLPRASATTAVVAGEVHVHVAGAVARPGVYRAEVGARVSELIDAAGGPAADADLDRINLAAPAADGSQVYVPRKGEAPPSGAAGAGASGDAVVDLNRATVDELDALPGIGPATAQAIVDHRTEHGPFRSVDDLLQVRGIGESKLAGLRKRVRV